LEFLEMFKDAAVIQGQAELSDVEQALNEVKASNEAVAAELNVRLNAARAAGDRAAQHALWREREVRQAEGQAKVDELTRSLNPVGFRFDALKSLWSSLDASPTLQPFRPGSPTTKANPRASNIPQAVYPLPQRRLIRTAVDAEVAAAEFMRQIGFADAKRTSSGADGGIDVIAAGAVAQVKTHMKPIGRPDLQRLSGVAKGRTTLFFSLEGYTPEARKWGDLEGMALFRFDYQGEASPINRAAKALMAVAVTATPAQTPPPAVVGAISNDTDLGLSPVVRSILAKRGIDPASISGTGKGGQITRADVLDFIGRHPPSRR
jgi:pyruvate/2-oxoglutarate dehydrogenase complex dihydrolipoamide acyltransferase (E2) component